MTAAEATSRLISTGRCRIYSAGNHGAPKLVDQVLRTSLGPRPFLGLCLLDPAAHLHVSLSRQLSAYWQATDFCFIIAPSSYILLHFTDGLMRLDKGSD